MQCLIILFFFCTVTNSVAQSIDLFQCFHDMIKNATDSRLGPDSVSTPYGLVDNTGQDALNSTLATAMTYRSCTQFCPASKGSWERMLEQFSAWVVPR
ncbi:hypothetical protein DL96DRAFT_272188 [Flagelloscypha sp. PMI_526]|nr:hypothetical protein DL96DRAFT_272188 [Flagelloscypha sp. PMI_526]